MHPSTFALIITALFSALAATPFEEGWLTGCNTCLKPGDKPVFLVHDKPGHLPQPGFPGDVPQAPSGGENLGGPPQFDVPQGLPGAPATMPPPNTPTCPVKYQYVPGGGCVEIKPKRS